MLWSFTSELFLFISESSSNSCTISSLFYCLCSGGCVSPLVSVQYGERTEYRSPLDWNKTKIPEQTASSGHLRPIHRTSSSNPVTKNMDVPAWAPLWRCLPLEENPHLIPPPGWKPTKVRTVLIHFDLDGSIIVPEQGEGCRDIPWTPCSLSIWMQPCLPWSTDWEHTAPPPQRFNVYQYWR